MSLPRAQIAVLVLLLATMLVAGSFTHPPRLSAQPASVGELDAAFTQAAAEFDIPRDLLVTVAYAETRFDDHDGQPSIDNGYGLMHLVDNPEVQTLPLAARLLGVDAEQLKHDVALNIRGGAAILRAYADEQGLTTEARKELALWYQVIARYSNASNAPVARFYADEVYKLLNEGVQGTSPEGETLVVAAQRIAPDRGKYEDAGSMVAQSADYGPALWVEAHSGNYTVANRTSIQKIVIHVTEGTYTSAINWFRNDASNVSAHYVIRSSDGQITQMVREKDIAWHAGYWDWNVKSIGIEHEAYVNNPAWYTDAMYRSSAALTRNIAIKYNIPMDRQHIIGHSEFKATKGDPGPYWDWTYFMQLVKQAPVSDNGDLIIDNTEPSFSRSGSWKERSCGYGKHTYWTYATNGSEGVASENSGTWRPNLPSTGQYKVLAHIPQGCGIASPPYATTNARYRVNHAGGTTEAVVNHNTGDQWVELGTFGFNAGTGGSVSLSDLTNEPYSARKVVFFDAVQWILQPPPSAAASAQLLSVRARTSNITVGEALPVEFTIKNTGNTTLMTQGPDGGNTADLSTGWVYDEAECFAGDTNESYPSYPKEPNALRVTLGLQSGSVATSCGSDPGGFPWRWGFHTPIGPGETRTVLGYVRFRTPGTYTFKANVIGEYVKYYGMDGGGANATLGPITVTPERRAPEAASFDGAFGPQASVYQLVPTPNTLLARTANPLSIVEGNYVGSFSWNGSDQNWGNGGPAGQTDRFIVRQTRSFIAPVAGTYRFRLTSDDGAWLWVDGVEVARNEGLHPLDSVEGSRYLNAGVHTLSIKAFENLEQAYLGYAWMPPNSSTFTPIPAPPIGEHVGPLFKGGQQMIITGDDLGGSGLRTLHYWINGTYATSTQPVSIALGSGNHVVEYEAEDNQGNRSSRARVSFTVNPALQFHYVHLPLTSR